MGCAKNRFIRSEKLLGATLSNGMPRVLDMGQCNDSYSAIVVANELAKALDCTVNDLPLSVSVWCQCIHPWRDANIDLFMLRAMPYLLLIYDELWQLALSHLEQKAAAVLLALLNMGVKNIRLGPSLPAYVTPNVMNVLVENYNLMPTTNAQDDVRKIMAGE